MGYIPDLLVDNTILECAGLGFGEEESLLLMKSIKVFSAVMQLNRNSHRNLSPKLSISGEKYTAA